MSKRWFYLVGFLISVTVLAQTTVNVRDNSDVAVTLSASNYNRLIVRSDKITEAHFPEQLLSVKSEGDGSLYAMPSGQAPFTLFLSTENGHHFSVTVSGDERLGQTVEFLAAATIKKEFIQKVNPEPSRVAKVSSENAPVDALIQAMRESELRPGFVIKTHFGRAIRLGNGWSLLPKKTYLGETLEGEVMMLYNADKMARSVESNWFAIDKTKAVFLEKTTVPGRARVFLYRVNER
jgi:conjugal transfer pilus assembly protein TraK